MTDGLWLVENMDPDLSLAKNRIKQILKERGHSNPNEGVLQLAMPLIKTCGRCDNFTPRYQQEGHICAVYSWPVYSEDRRPCKTKAVDRFTPISMKAMIMEKTYTREEMKEMVVEWYRRKSQTMTTSMFDMIQIQRVYRSGFTYELAGDVMMLNFEDFEDRSKWAPGYETEEMEFTPNHFKILLSGLHGRYKSALGSSRLMELYRQLIKTHPMSEEQFTKYLQIGMNEGWWYLRSGAPLGDNQGHLKIGSNQFYYLKLR